MQSPYTATEARSEPKPSPTREKETETTPWKLKTVRRPKGIAFKRKGHKFPGCRSVVNSLEAVRWQLLDVV